VGRENWQFSEQEGFEKTVVGVSDVCCNKRLSFAVGANLWNELPSSINAVTLVLLTA